MKLRKIPIKKNLRKCPHPQQSNWHNAMTPEEKKKYSKKISLAMKAYHNKKTTEQKELSKKRMKEKKSLFFGTPKGREEKLYRQYLSRNYQLGLDGEERDIIFAKRGVGMKKFWDNVSPERKQEMIDKRETTKKKIVSRFLEFDVPRENDFCGVVYMEEEELMHG